MINRLLSRLGIDPYLLALIGTVLLAVVLPARGDAAALAKEAAVLAVSLLFFLYGARLAPQAVLAGIAHWRLQSLVLLATFVLFPLLGLLLLAGLRRFLPPDLAFGLMFLCVLPSTVQSSIAFTSIARGNVPAALCSASASNLFGMVLTPALVGLLLTRSGMGFSPGALGDIALQLLLPFGLGQVARPLIGRVLERNKRVTSLVDRGSILIVVYVAFGESVVAGVWSTLDLRALGLVLVLDGVLLALALLATTGASRWLGFSKEDEIAIVFCGSKKSMASGIPMANILFPGHSLGLVVMPLMLFHQIQLFACAVLAQRYARRPPAAEASRPLPRSA